MKKRNVRSLILGVCLLIIPGQIFCQFQKGIRADLGMSDIDVINVKPGMDYFPFRI